VPFIVLFCQVIETRDRHDLARLHGFVSSLQLEKVVVVDSGVSEAVDKLRRLFQVLYSVATQYVGNSQTTNSAHGHQQQPKNSMEIDTCLAALGFPSSSQQQQGVIGGEQHQHQLQELGGGAGVQYLPGGTMAGDIQRGVNPMIWMGNGAQLEDWFYNNQQMMAFLEDGFPGEAGWGGGG
jgi:hypothetical protein